eukprot:7338235-Ditylum_brightwellii.AAC.1
MVNMAGCSKEAMDVEPAIALSVRHTDMRPVKLFEAEFIELGITLAGHTIATPLFGDIFKNKNKDKEPIILWSGTDPDSKINCHFWSKDDSKWKIPIFQHLSRV